MIINIPISPLHNLKILRADVAGGDGGDAVDGDDEAAVALDTLYDAFGALEEAAGHTYAVALKELRGGVVEPEEVVGDRGYKDEHVHLPGAHRFDLFLGEVAVKINRAPEQRRELPDIFFSAIDEQKSRSELGLVVMYSILFQTAYYGGSGFEDSGCVPVICF